MQYAQLGTDAGMKQKTKADVPYCSPPPNPSEKLVLSYPVCHLAEDDSKPMETEAGKIQSKAR